VLDGRLVLAVAGCGVALQFVSMSLAKPRGIRDELLVGDAGWAAGMAVVIGWALAIARRGPTGGRAAAWCAVAVSLVGVACVAVELIRYILHPSWL
jgi:hypothetical protein